MKEMKSMVFVMVFTAVLGGVLSAALIYAA